MTAHQRILAKRQAQIRRMLHREIAAQKYPRQERPLDAAMFPAADTSWRCSSQTIGSSLVHFYGVNKMLNAVQRISRLEAALKNLCETINAISGQCDGLSGFHLNGDIASFEESGIDDAVNTAMVVLKEE